MAIGVMSIDAGVIIIGAAFTGSSAFALASGGTLSPEAAAIAVAGAVAGTGLIVTGVAVAINAVKDLIAAADNSAGSGHKQQRFGE